MHCLPGKRAFTQIYIHLRACMGKNCKKTCVKLTPVTLSVTDVGEGLEKPEAIGASLFSRTQASDIRNLAY